MMDEYYAGDVLRSAADERRILDVELGVHKAKSALFWMTFRACFGAMCLWSVVTNVAKVLMSWWVS